MLRGIYNNLFKKSQNSNIFDIHIENVINNIEYLNEIERFEDFNKELFYKKLIEKYPVGIKYINVKYHTIENCEIAVNKIPDLIKFVKYQTLDMCKKVINKKPSLIKYCLYQTEDMAFKALYYDYKLIEYIQNQKLDMCKYVVESNPYYFKFIKVQNIYLCKLACNVYPEYIELCNVYDEELYINVLKKNPDLIKFIDKNKQTEYMLAIILNNPLTDLSKIIKFIKLDLLKKFDINTLYEFIYKEENLEITDICSICLDEYVINQKITNTLCNHYYHTDCINDWLKQNKKCPLCNNILI